MDRLPGSARSVVAIACLVASVAGWPASRRSASVALSAHLDGLLVRLAGRADVAGLARRGPRRAPARRSAAASDQLVVDVALLPEQLIDGPRRNRRLVQRADLGAARAGLLRERVTGRREVRQRQLIEPGDVLVYREVAITEV